MSKKIISASLFVLCTALPAMAATVNWNTSGAKKDLMEAGNTYTNAATLDHMGVDTGTVDANPWYNIIAGYYLPKNSLDARLCPAGKYCAGIENVGLDTTQDQGITGDIAAGYYSTGGATKATPTSNSDCVGSGSCGACASAGSGYTSAAGSSDITQCYKTGTISCGDVFPVTANVAGPAGWNYDYGYGAVTGVIYGPLTGTPDSTGTPASMYYSSATASGVTTTAVDCISRVKSNGSTTVCTPTNPTKCLVRGVTCGTDYHPRDGAIEMTTSTMHEAFTDGASDGSNSANNNATYANSYSAEQATTGTFNVFYNQSGTGASAARGVWRKKNAGSDWASGLGSYDADCYCQIQNVKAGDNWYPVVSAWVKAAYTSSTGLDCGTLCTQKFADLSSTVATVALYQYVCKINTSTVLLFANGGSGSIQNKVVSAFPNGVPATCSSGYSIGSPASATSNYVAQWSSSSGVDKTNITKSGKIFVGWSADSACASASCVTTDTCQEENDTAYYAAWATPSCTAGTGATTSGTPTVSNNKVVCNRANKAGYFCSSTQTGANMVANVTVTCETCPAKWTSTAGGATANTGCTRSITLNNNGADSGTVATSQTCNYNTNCNLPSTSGLKKAGYTYTGGWGTSSSCTSDSATVKITDTTSNTVTYYACRTANDITINWTGVSSVPANSGFGTISNNAVSSTVKYNGDIVTPSAPAVAAAGQTFLGWKFEK